MAKFQENPKESGKELSEEMKRLNKFEAVNTHKRVDYSATSTESNDNPILEHLMKSCSTFAKARRTLAYVLQFANNTRLKAKKKDTISRDESELWLRATAYKYEECGDRSKISDFVLFHLKDPFGEPFSKIALKLSIALSF